MLALRYRHLAPLSCVYSYKKKQMFAWHRQFWFVQQVQVFQKRPFKFFHGVYLVRAPFKRNACELFMNNGSSLNLLRPDPSVWLFLQPAVFLTFLLKSCCCSFRLDFAAWYQYLPFCCGSAEEVVVVSDKKQDMWRHPWRFTHLNWKGSCSFSCNTFWSLGCIRNSWHHCSQAVLSSPAQWLVTYMCCCVQEIGYTCTVIHRCTSV